MGNIPFRGDSDRLLVFRASIDPNVQAGSRIASQGTITADNLDVPTRTNEAVLTVLGPLQLDTATKDAVDGNGDGRFEPGEVVTYRILISNPHNRAVGGVRFEDDLPPYVDVLQAFATTGENASPAGGQRVVFENMSIPPAPSDGALVTIVARIHDEDELVEDGVALGEINGFNIDNQARVTAAANSFFTRDPTPANGAPAGVTRITLSSETDISGGATRKTAVDVNGGRLVPGDLLRFTIQVSNTGSSSANVFLDDRLPDGLEACAVASNHPSISCEGGLRARGFIAVDPGAVESVVLTARVSEDTANGTVIQNRVNLSAGAQRVERVASPLTVTSAPDLSGVTKVAVGPVNGVAVPGQTYRYRIQVNNRGNRVANNVVITDPLTHNFAAVRPLDGGVYAAASNRVTWNLGALDAGAERVVELEVTLADQVPDGTVIQNQATTAFAEGDEPILSDDPTTAQPSDATRVRVQSQPLLVVEKRVDRPVAEPGQVVTYTLNVRNDGTDAARNITVTDPLPAERFVDIQSAGQVNGGEVVWSAATTPALARLDVGDSVELSVQARLLPVLDDGTRIENQARADAGFGPSVSDDPTTPAPNDPTVVNIRSAADLVFTKRVEDLNGGDPQPGDRFRYTLEVSNRGNSAALDVLVTDPIPAGFVDVAQFDGGRAVAGEIIWPVRARLEVGGAPLVFRFEGTADPALGANSVISNQARLTTGGGDARVSDDPSTAAVDDPTRVRLIARPDLTTSIKRVEPLNPEPGDEVTWFIQIVNSGTVAATNVTVIDPLPTNFVEGFVVDGGQVANGQATARFAEILAGGAVGFTITGRVRAGVEDGTQVSNQATVSADGTAAVVTDDPATEAPDDATVFEVSAVPRLTVTKAVIDENGSPARPSDRLTYVFRVENIGTGLASNVQLLDRVPDALAVLDSQGAQAQGANLTWRLGQLEPGQQTERRLSVQLNAPLDNGLIISNQAQVSGSNLEVDAVLSDDPNTPEPTDPTEVQVISAADLSGLTKSVRDLNGPPVRPGDRLEYSLVVSNRGDAIGTNVVLIDELPPELTAIEAPGAQLIGQTVRYELGQLAPGAQIARTITATVASPIPDQTQIGNQASITADGVAQPFVSDNPETDALDDATVVTVTSSAVIALEKRVEPANSNLFRAGGDVRFVLTLTNRGDAPSGALEVLDDLPDGLVAPFGLPAEAVLDGRTVRWRVDELVPGSDQTLSFTARIDAAVEDGVVIRNVASVGAVSDAAQFTVTNRPALDASTKEVSGDNFPGGVVTYTITVVNDGSERAEGIRVVDALPPELEFIGAQPEAAERDGVLSWFLGGMRPSRQATIRVEARVRDGLEDGRIVANQAVVSADGLADALTDDPNTPDVDDATRFTVENRPVLELRKSVRDENGGAFVPGDPVTYILSVRNVGGGDARDLELIDPIPPGLVNPIAVEGTVEVGVAEWRTNRLAAGSTRDFELRARLSDDLDRGTVVSNLFEARAANHPPVQSDAVTLTVETGVVTPRKTVRAVEGDFYPGSLVEFAIELRNDGENGVGNVSVADPIDLAVFEDIAPLDNGRFLDATSTVEWSPESTNALRFIPAGGTVSVRLRARIVGGVAPGETLTNRALVAVRGDVERPEALVSFDVVGRPEYALEKAVSSSSTRPGDVVDYELRVTNVGDSDGVGARLVDNLPEALEYVPNSVLRDGLELPDVDGRSPLESGVSLDALPPNGSVTFSISARLREDAQAGDTVLNTATVEDERGVVADGDASFIVQGLPDLSGLVKFAEVLEPNPDGSAYVGGQVRWTLEMENTGDDIATGVRLVDPIRSGHRYLEGTLTLDGVALTDDDDDDAGRADDDIVVLFGRIEPGQSHTIAFVTEVVEGPELVNQAVLTEQGGSRILSDDGGEDDDAPTRVPVRERIQPRLEFEKRLVDRESGEAAPGEVVRFELRFGNSGNADLESVTVFDQIPSGLSLIRINDLPADFTEDIQGQTVSLSGALAAESERSVTLDMQVDASIGDDVELCNEAGIRSGDLEAVLSTACVRVIERTGEAGGTLFQDSDGVSGLSEGDLRFEGLLVRAYQLGADERDPFAEAASLPDGSFEFPELPAGPYRFAVLSASGVVLANVDAVDVEEGTPAQVDIAIDPSGRVYDSASGALIDGAIIRIYRDRDTNNDPFDESSLASRELVDPDDLEHPSQQSQRTSNGGLYQFAVKEPGRYLIEVSSPGVSYLAPSTRITPEPGFADTAEPDIVSNAIPSVEPGQAQTYYTAFSLESPDLEYRNNHIPLDPISSLIDLTKRTRRTQAYIGDIVTFEVTLRNRSDVDLVRAPSGGLGGVRVQDILPKGLKYVSGSAVLSRVDGATEVPLSAAEPVGERLLVFGAQSESGERINIDFHAGETLRLRYQTVVDSNARPRSTYTNRARLLADGNIPISDTAEAKVTILADPDFDQGLLLGRVFCDSNSDGRQDVSELGAPGVYLYMDHGYQAITDANGLFHFKDIDPGTHMVKLDRNSLLPGAQLTTDESRVISFTRGLPAKVAFGVTCPQEKVTEGSTEVTDTGLVEALRTWRTASIGVSVGGAPLAVSLGPRRLTMPSIDATHSASAPDPDGGALVIVQAIIQDPTRWVSWELWVGETLDNATPLSQGQGAIPPRIEWRLSKTLAEAGWGYQLRLRDRDGTQVHSKWVVGYAAKTARAGVRLLARIPADRFDGASALSAALKKDLDALLDELNSSTGPIRVSVHHDNSKGPFTSRSFTRRRARAVAAYLVELGVKEERITAEGKAGSQPVSPNLTSRGRRKNRRIDVHLTTPKTVVAPAPQVGRLVFGLRGVELNDEDRFDGQLAVPLGRTFRVALQTQDGARLMASTSLPRAEMPDSVRDLEVTGQLGKTLSVGTHKAPLIPPSASLNGPRQVASPAPDQVTEVKWQVKDADQPTRWVFSITRATGEDVEYRSGTGSPPKTLSWSLPSAIEEGYYVARLTLIGATSVWDVRDVLTVGQPLDDPPMARPDRFVINGRSATLNDDKTFKATTQIGPKAPLIFDITRGDRRWLVSVLVPRSAIPQVNPPKSTSAERDPMAATGASDTLGASQAAPLAAPAKAATATLAGQDSGSSTRVTPAMTGAARPDNVGLLEAIVPETKASKRDTEVVTSVFMPASGAQLSGDSLSLRGSTEPGRRVMVNGREMPVDSDGQFGGAVPLKPGNQQVEVVATAEDGRRSTVRRQVQVPDSGWFLLALSEGVVGTVDSELDGVEAHTAVEIEDQVYLHGRAVAWFRGYMSGEKLLGGLFKRYAVEGHLDTARRARFESTYRQLIDPTRFYPVYGDDGKEAKLVNTRGPVYVLLRADSSTITVGNFRTQLKGVELFRYDRSHYGAQAQLDLKTGDFHHEVTAFGTDESVDQRHAYVEFRGTGGSLFYLPHREVLQGSEQVFLVERDRVSGVERSRRQLARDQDYQLRYTDGRLLFYRPVSSASMGLFGAGEPNALGGALDGHPVYVAIEYDHLDPTGPGERSMGVHARETWKGAVSVGGGYVQTGRENQGTPDYRLYGADLRLRHGRRTHLDAEVARSRSLNAESLQSSDGGLTFTPFHRRTANDGEGSSFLVRGGFELNDLMGEPNQDAWYSEGYWQYLQSGFSSGGTIQQQGLEKYGGLSRVHFGEGHFAHVRHDGWVAESPETQGLGDRPAFQRQVSRVGYGYKDQGLRLDSEFVYTQSDEGPTEPILRVGTFVVGGEYTLDPRWTLIGQQEVVVMGDRRLHDTTTDLLASTVGARYRAGQYLHFEALETVRWSGDNATQVGVRTDIDDRHSLYLQERYADVSGSKTNTAVIGAEERFGEDRSGRAYGEYQVQSGDTTQQNTMVMGVAKKTTIAEGLVLDVGYERSQASGNLPGTTSRDAVFTGAMWQPNRRLTLSGRYEFRYEDYREVEGRRDRYQFVTLNDAKLKLHRDWTFATQVNFSHTYDLEVDATEAELLEGNLGLAYRPPSATWLVVLFKYAKRFEQRPIDVSVELPEREESDVLSVTPIFELPWDFQLVEKLALKRSALRVDRLPTVVSNSLLWINRLNYHLTETWDAGVEYRLLQNSLASNLRHGALVELNYIIKKRIRLGVGYNFTSFSDDEFARYDETFGGPFFRVVGNY